MNNKDDTSTIDLQTLTNETDGEYIIHNINKSIHPVHVMFRRLVDSYALDLSIDASTAAINLLKEVKEEFPKTILVKRIIVQQQQQAEEEDAGRNATSKTDDTKSAGRKEYRFLKYQRMDALAKISHVISTKRFNNRKRRKNTTMNNGTHTSVTTNSSVSNANEQTSEIEHGIIHKRLKNGNLEGADSALFISTNINNDNQQQQQQQQQQQNEQRRKRQQQLSSSSLSGNTTVEPISTTSSSFSNDNHQHQQEQQAQSYSSLHYHYQKLSANEISQDQSPQKGLQEEQIIRDDEK